MMGSFIFSPGFVGPVGVTVTSAGLTSADAGSIPVGSTTVGDDRPGIQNTRFKAGILFTLDRLVGRLINYIRSFLHS